MAANDPFGDFRRRRGSLFDEFFSEFFDRPFGVEGGMSPSGAGTSTSAPPARRPVEQVDITQFFSDATRELLQRAAQLALEWGSLDLDTEHLLSAAMQDFIDEVRPTDDGDWLTLVRRARLVPRDRVEDYIAAATATGPLVPDSEPH